MKSRKSNDITPYLLMIGVPVILAFIIIALVTSRHGIITPSNVGKEFTTLSTSDLKETGQTYFTYRVHSKRKYVNFLNSLDKEKYEIFVISHSRYTFTVTYRLKNRSSLEKVTGNQDFSNDIILYYTGSKSDYLNFLETLDAEKYAIFDVCEGDTGFYVTYIEKN